MVVCGAKPPVVTLVIRSGLMFIATPSLTREYLLISVAIRSQRCTYRYADEQTYRHSEAYRSVTFIAMYLDIPIGRTPVTRVFTYSSCNPRLEPHSTVCMAPSEI